MSSAQHSDDFYSQGKAYWETIPATVDGMLGGYSEISSTDVHSSNRLLKQFQENKAAPLGRQRALDCGAGIGRITKHLLLPLFDTVDMVEQNQAFLDQARAYIGPESERVENLFCEGLQDFAPKEGYYDVIWCQWVTGHLTDADLVSFVQRCLRGLRENGIFVIKDNITQDSIDVDNRDGSITRPRELILQLFEKAGAQVLADRKQYRFPKGLYEVRTFAMSAEGGKVKAVSILEEVHLGTLNTDALLLRRVFAMTEIVMVSIAGTLHPSFLLAIALNKRGTEHALNEVYQSIRERRGQRRERRRHGK